MKVTDDTIETQPGKPCPICGKPAVQRHRPFCSRRCADVDLHRWLAGVYAAPAKEEEDEDGAPSERESRSKQQRDDDA
jgi:hypothetical protein